MESKKQSEDILSLTDTHFNNDESFYYHLKDIVFDVFLTLHFKRKKYYSKSDDSDCNRRKFFREAFGNLTRYLQIPHKSLFYFGIAESDWNNKMHCHLLLKFRKDLKLSDEDKVKSVNKIFLLNWDYFRFKDTNQRCLEIVNDSQDATNYMLKIKTFDEKKSKSKENYYHSKNFKQICKYMKSGTW